MLSFFFFNDTATTEIYTLSLHDALPISPLAETSSEEIPALFSTASQENTPFTFLQESGQNPMVRSEEHTSELQSRLHLVCRLLLEKKKLICTESTYREWARVRTATHA